MAAACSGDSVVGWAAHPQHRATTSATTAAISLDDMEFTLGWLRVNARGNRSTPLRMTFGLVAGNRVSSVVALRW